MVIISIIIEARPTKGVRPALYINADTRPFKDRLVMSTKREQQKEIRREKIVKAALEHFTKNGFEATTVQKITTQAGIAKGTFFNFFKKKEDVLLYFLDKEISKSTREIERKINACKTFEEQIALLIATFIKNIFSNRDFAKVLIRERVAKFGTGSKTNEHTLMATLAHLIEAAQKRGEIKPDIDPDRTAEMIFAIYSMYVIYWANGFIKTKRAVVARIQEVIRHILNGIGMQHSPPFPQVRRC